MDSEGTNRVRLTDDPAEDWFPSWSTDGKRIAFVSKRDGDFEIYSMDSDGSHQRNLTRNPATDNTPAWSPDGKKIAFWSSRDGGGIFLMDSDGSHIQRLTNNDSDFYPAWSGDGKKIFFDSSRDAYQPQIYTMNSDGSDVLRVSKIYFGPRVHAGPRVGFYLPVRIRYPLTRTFILLTQYQYQFNQHSRDF